MKALKQWQEGLITMKEMVDAEMRFCDYDDCWLKDALGETKSISDGEFISMVEIIRDIMRARALNRILTREGR